jgi:dsRNA-specific ribonuclease
VQVVFNKKPMGVGIGKNKKEAENIAAQNTLKKL